MKVIFKPQDAIIALTQAKNKYLDEYGMRRDILIQVAKINDKIDYIKDNLLERGKDCSIVLTDIELGIGDI